MTPRARQLLDIIRASIEETGLAPTYDQMRVSMGLASKSGVDRLIRALVASGHLKKVPHRTRALSLPGHEHLPSIPTDALVSELRRRVSQ